MNSEAIHASVRKGKHEKEILYDVCVTVNGVRIV